MNKSYKQISKLVLVSYIAGTLIAGPAMAAPEGVKLRGTIDDTLPGIQLKGGIAIDKHKNLINLNLRDTDVKQVLRMIADKAGKNIVFHDSVNGKITLDLVNVTLDKAFEYVMTISGLTYWQDGNSLIVASKSVASGLSINKTQLKPIQIKYLDAIKVADFLNTNIFSINKPDISVNQVAISNPRTNQVLILGNENDIALAKKTIELIDVKPLMKTFDINYSDPGVIAANICTTVFNVETAASASTSSSGGSGSSGTTAGNVIVCSSKAPEGSGSSAATVSSGGEGTAFSGITSTPQSLATSGYIVMVDSGLNKISISGSQDQINLAEDLIQRFDKKQPQVYIEISIVELSESGSKSLSNTIMAQTRNTTFQFATGESSYQVTDKSLASVIPENFSEYALGKGIISHTITNLIQNRKGRVLSNPRIIATNNKTSVVNISSDFVKSRKLQRTIADGTVLTDITYEIGESGIKMDITPKVSANGYVTLNINPSYTALKEQVKDGTDLIATLLNRRDLTLENLRIKDGETLIIGGLIQETDSNDVKKIPLIGDIPVIGALFRDSSSDRSRSELILMITPKILQEDDTVSAI